MTSEEFHVNRYNGVLSVMKKEREQFAALEKKYKQIQSDYNKLMIKYMSLQQAVKLI